MFSNSVRFRSTVVFKYCKSVITVQSYVIWVKLIYFFEHIQSFLIQYFLIRLLSLTARVLVPIYLPVCRAWHFSTRSRVLKLNFQVQGAKIRSSAHLKFQKICTKCKKFKVTVLNPLCATGILKSSFLLPRIIRKFSDLPRAR